MKRTSLSEDEEDDEEPDGDQRVAQKRDNCGRLRPAEPVVEARNDNERNEADRHEDHDQPLRRLCLLGWAALDAALEQGEVVDDQILGHQRRRAEEHGQKHPCLPEPQIAGRCENERAHDHRDRDEPKPCLQALGHRRAPVLTSA